MVSCLFTSMNSMYLKATRNWLMNNEEINDNESLGTSAIWEDARS